MAADSKKSRKSNFSQQEIDVLTTTVMHNHDILYGETSKSFYHKEIRNQVWNIVLEEVNKVSLEKRTLSEIKNKWKKCNASFKNTEHLEFVDNDDLDSMPLQQRLSHGSNSDTSTSTPQPESVLQSQPISPTKLKVTRQGAKPILTPQKPPTPVPPPPENVCLRWNSHQSHIQTSFPSILMKEQYVDATLVSEGKTLKCHRIILSSCSPYFEQVLEEITPLQHPVLFMKDIPFWILKALCDFMYAGEVHILQNKLDELLAVAETLQIRGLAGTHDTQEDVKPIIIPEIKQEIETPAPAPPKRESSSSRERHEKVEKLPKLDKPVKEEKEELKREPTPVKQTKKKEDKKSKHQSQAKEKEKEKVIEEPPVKLLPKLTPPRGTPPKAAPPPPKAAPPPRAGSSSKLKIVPKIVIPKTAHQKPPVKNVPKPSTSSRSSSKKSEKHKPEPPPLKEKEKEKEKVPSKKAANYTDPLDLLRPVYEEIAKEEPPKVAKAPPPGKLKDRNIQVPKKALGKTKVKKRRYEEFAEERDESPPLVFSSRKGTRSRPNVKIPKFFHTHYDDTAKETSEATIVREPHTDQNDPLIGVESEIEEIKAEPVDVEESTLAVEENLVNFMVQGQEMLPHEEEIMGSYDSPIVNIKREKTNTPNIFKRVKMVEQPVIMNVHTVTEDSEANVRLLNLREENVKLVDISKIGAPSTQTSEFMISNVQSMADMPQTPPEPTGLRAVRIKQEIREDSPGIASPSNLVVSSDIRRIQSDQSIVPPDLNPLVSSSHQVTTMETDQTEFRIKIETVESETSENADENIQNQSEHVTNAASTISLNIQSQVPIQTEVSVGILGSLEDKTDDLAMETEEFPDEPCVPESAKINLNIPQENIEQPGGLGSLGSLETKLDTLDVQSSSDLGSLERKIDTLGIESSSSLGSLERKLGTLEVQTSEVPRNVDSLAVAGEHSVATQENPLEFDEEREVIENIFVSSLEEPKSIIQPDENPLALDEEKCFVENPCQSNVEEPQNIGNSVEAMSLGSEEQPLHSLPDDNIGDTSEGRKEESKNIENNTKPMPQDNVGQLSYSGHGPDPIPLDFEGQGFKNSLLVPETEAHECYAVVEESVERNEIKSVEMLSLENESQGFVQTQAAAELQAIISTPPLVADVKPDAELDVDTALKSNETAVDETTASRVESTDNIEAELEQCLASTSGMVPPKHTKEPVDIDASKLPLPFDEDDDFTKDIEFDTFIGRNRPANVLGDDGFGNDFEMAEVVESKESGGTSQPPTEDLKDNEVDAQNIENISQVQNVVHENIGGPLLSSGPSEIQDQNYETTGEGISNNENLNVVQVESENTDRSVIDTVENLPQCPSYEMTDMNEEINVNEDRFAFTESRVTEISEVDRFIPSSEENISDNVSFNPQQSVEDVSGFSQDLGTVSKLPENVSFDQGEEGCKVDFSPNLDKPDKEKEQPMSCEEYESRSLVSEPLVNEPNKTVNQNVGEIIDERLEPNEDCVKQTLEYSESTSNFEAQVSSQHLIPHDSFPQSPVCKTEENKLEEAVIPDSKQFQFERQNVDSPGAVQSLVRSSSEEVHLSEQNIDSYNLPDAATMPSTSADLQLTEPNTDTCAPIRSPLRANPDQNLELCDHSQDIVTTNTIEPQATDENFDSYKPSQDTADDKNTEEKMMVSNTVKPQPTEQNFDSCKAPQGTEEPNTEEDDKKLEESLLADLDEDVEMEDASTERQTEEGAEKSLEMIINEMNESLMRK